MSVDGSMQRTISDFYRAVIARARRWNNRLPAGWRELFWLAVLFVLFALVHPAEGLGFDFCMLHRITGLPCPGCGMTRSVSCLLRGHIRESLVYHPFGVLMLAGIVGLALFALAPENVRLALQRRMLEWHRFIRMVGYGLAVLFLTFGLTRMILAAVGLLNS